MSDTTTAAAAGKPRSLDFDPDAFLARQERTSQKAALEGLLNFKLNDVRVFDTTPTDLMRSAGEQAHAMLIVLSNAIAESTDPASENMTLRPVHIGRAIDAVETLISLSLFASDGRVLS